MKRKFIKLSTGKRGYNVVLGVPTTTDRTRGELKGARVESSNDDKRQEIKMKVAAAAAEMERRQILVLVHR
jgi:hypothetical protein